MRDEHVTLKGKHSNAVLCWRVKVHNMVWLVKISSLFAIS